jgi:hypothetical protein
VYRTTLEQFRAPIFADNVCDKNGWSLGKVNNVREVFGLSPLVWCLPLQTHLGDGLAFPHSRAHQHTTTYNSIGGQYSIHYFFCSLNLLNSDHKFV